MASSIVNNGHRLQDKVFAVNACGAFLATRAIFPYVKGQSSKSILNVGSTTMLRTSNGIANRNPHYVASKGAVMAFTRAISRELGEFNINVNTLAPGGTYQGVGLDHGEATREESRAFGRRGVPSDIVGTVAFLLPDNANFIAGQLIAVNRCKEVS
jgi:NAD(P)-dependent dehydrogenase (short-subunit alcohol dehydrogenase family)